MYQFKIPRDETDVLSRHETLNNIDLTHTPGYLVLLLLDCAEKELDGREGLHAKSEWWPCDTNTHSKMISTVYEVWMPLFASLVSDLRIKLCPDCYACSVSMHPWRTFEQGLAVPLRPP